ncbi:hypothetical protein HDV02_000008 [Globomyces sp. JEL0801]|nr:hypothetical protein HDV02_000008 [Globomyces sp. JEL0801]
MVFWKLYAFARVTDDMIDHAKSDQERIEQLTIIQDFLDTKVVHDEQPSFRALLTLRVPMELIQSLIDGFKLDSNPTSFETDKQLLQYCHHVASSIGALSVHLFSCPHLQKEAETLGLALQLINIARDVKEDFLDNGRVYLIGITKNDVLSWISNEQKSRVDESIDWCLNTSEKLMEDNHVIDAMNQLSVKFQRATLAAYVMYNDINIRIRSGMESDKSDYKNRVM